MGDAGYDPDKQAAPAPPSLRKEGETLPPAATTTQGEMKPVEFPKQKPDDYPDATNLPRTPQQPADKTDNPAADDSEPAAPAANPQSTPSQNTPPTPGQPH
jgi:hypothetical protein